MHVLRNGSAITDITPGSTPVYVPGYAMIPLSAVPGPAIAGAADTWLERLLFTQDADDLQPHP